MKEQALELLRQGKGVREVSRLLSVSKSNVSRWAKESGLATKSPSVPPVSHGTGVPLQANTEYLHPWYVGKDFVSKSKYNHSLLKYKEMRDDRDFYMAGTDIGEGVEQLLETLGGQGILAQNPSVSEVIEAFTLLLAVRSPLGDTWVDSPNPSEAKWGNTRTYVLCELKKAISYIISQREQ